MAKLVLLYWPSWVWKTTVIKQMKKKLMFWELINTTTRKPRKWELNGEDYYFVSKKEFLELLRNWCFVEVAERYWNFYWLLKSELKSKSKGNELLLTIVDIEWIKFWKVNRKKYKNLIYKIISVLILPHSKENLKDRIKNRKDRIDKDDDFYSEESLKSADYIIISDKIEEIKNLLLIVLNNI